MFVLSRYPIQLLGRLSGWAVRVKAMIGVVGTRRTPVPADVQAHDLSALRCFREAYIERLTDRDCAEFYAPDGRLVWEDPAPKEGASGLTDATTSRVDRWRNDPQDRRLEGGSW